MRRLIVLLIAIGVIVSAFFFIKNRTQKTNQNNNLEKPLSAQTTVDLSPNCKLYIVINSDSVWVEPYENICSNAKSFSIETALSDSLLTITFIFFFVENIVSSKLKIK